MRIPLLLAFSALLGAADQIAPAPRQLDPTKPADAVIIVDVLTKHATWPGQDREQVIALERALATLAAVVDLKPAPVEMPKAKP